MKHLYIPIQRVVSDSARRYVLFDKVAFTLPKRLVLLPQVQLQLDTDTDCQETEAEQTEQTDLVYQPDFLERKRQQYQRSLCEA